MARRRLVIGRYWLEFESGRAPTRLGERVALFPFYLHLSLSKLIPPQEWSGELEEQRTELEVNPTDTLARFAFGNGLRMAGRFDEARAEYQRVVDEGTGHWVETAQQLLSEFPHGVWEGDVGGRAELRGLWNRGTRPWYVRWPRNPQGKTKMVAIWNRVILGPQKSWVLFENGTVVILMKPEGNLAEQAIVLLKEWGPVFAGSPAGDFQVVHLHDESGWVVTGHHPDILNYVSPIELATVDQNDITIGLLGRSKRDKDGLAPKVIHVEDRFSLGVQVIKVVR